MRRVHVIVTGRVQGVGFRFTAQAAASRAGATGWVRNRMDGTVEAQIEGSEAAVGAVLDAIRTGPRGSRVTQVEVEEIVPHSSTVFEIRRDG